MARTLKDAAIEFFARKAIVDFLTNIRKDRLKMGVIQGAKTYIIAALLLALGAAKFLGFEVPGVSGESDPGFFITAALGLIFARVGAKTEARKVAENISLTNR